MAKKKLLDENHVKATPLTVLVFILMVLTLQGISFSSSESPSLNTLINDSIIYDSQTVHVSGEGLLEPLERSDGVWVNINDGTNAIGVFMPAEVSKSVKTYGNYHQKGDSIDIQAVFHRSCKEHGGDLDLHLVKLNHVTPGIAIEHPIDSKKVAWTIGLIFISTLVALYYRRQFFINH